MELGQIIKEVRQIIEKQTQTIEEQRQSFEEQRDTTEEQRQTIETLSGIEEDARSKRGRRPDPGDRGARRTGEWGGFQGYNNVSSECQRKDGYREQEWFGASGAAALVIYFHLVEAITRKNHGYGRLQARVNAY